MTLRAVVDNGEGFRLDGMALRALIGAVEFQLADWRGKTEEDLGEDDFADLQNDIQSHEILLANLQAEYKRISALRGL